MVLLCQRNGKHDSRRIEQTPPSADTSRTSCSLFFFRLPAVSRLTVYQERALGGLAREEEYSAVLVAQRGPATNTGFPSIFDLFACLPAPVVMLPSVGPGRGLDPGARLHQHPVAVPDTNVRGYQHQITPTFQSVFVPIARG